MKIVRITRHAAEEMNREVDENGNACSTFDHYER